MEKPKALLRRPRRWPARRKDGKLQEGDVVAALCPLQRLIGPSLASEQTMLAKDVKRGAMVVYHDAPCLIESVTVQTPSARGATTLYKFRGRNVLTKQKVDLTLKGGESIQEADFARREVKLMYSDAAEMHFLDQADYNQYSLPLEDVEDETRYLTEETEGVLALIYNDACVGLQLPTTVALKVTQCDPRVKGDSATSHTKPATLETGLVVQVPDYLSQGEVIKVDTRTGQYLSRM